MGEAEDRAYDLGAFIREQRSSARLSLRRLSDLAGISNPYLSQIERGLRKPSAEILQQIAKALRISAETLYVRAGILEDREGEHDLAGEILRDPFITEDQKQTLIKVYLSFRHENERDQANEGEGDPSPIGSTDTAEEEDPPPAG
ncbi:MAG TPA: helix-turn-helix transcriptional regulator [Acidimicrobiales bacterium]|nr:helix-turn-helix transcriptional regulator [Acidimicrobiales bacterium]